MGELLLKAGVWLAATPTPSPTSGPSDDSVTPGVVGFTVTFLIAVAAVLLVLDMTRRIRRVRYREEIAQKLDAEAGEPKDGAEPDDTDGDVRR